MSELTAIQFLRKVGECVKEFKKKSLETRDDSDTAHFFDPALKTFLKNHKEELNILSTMNYEKPFMTWMKLYLLKD